MKHSESFSVFYKKPTCIEDEMYLNLYKKMIEQINKIEEKIEKCKAECVLKVDCKETRANDKEYFKEFFDDILKEIGEMKDGIKEMVKEIGNLKTWRAWMSGAMAVIVFFIPFVISWVMAHEQNDKQQFKQLEAK